MIDDKETIAYWEEHEHNKVQVLNFALFQVERERERERGREREREREREIYLVKALLTELEESRLLGQALDPTSLQASP